MSANLFVMLSERKRKKILNTALYKACNKMDKKTAEDFIVMGAKPDSVLRHVSGVSTNMGYTKRPRMIEMLHKLGATNLNESLLITCRNNFTDCKRVVRKLIELGATNLNEALLIACSNGSGGVAIELAEAGATNVNEARIKALQEGHNVVAEIMTVFGARDPPESSVQSTS